MTTIPALLALVSFCGICITSLQVWLVRRFLRRTSEGLPGAVRSVSILKPVCGLDDELEANLVSFTRLIGVDYEVIVSAESWEDPAVPVVRKVMREHPQAPFRLVVDGGSARGVVNRKVERLIAAARVAKGDILFISDSNARMQPRDLHATVSLFRGPDVGCVSNVFRGAGAADLGAALESLHLASFVAPGAVLAASAGVPCVVGKSMAITREALGAVGGFERFRTVLAEDQAIGVAIRRAGFAVALSPIVVDNVIVKRSIRRALDRQVRWNKIRFAFSRTTYTAELLLNPLVFAAAAFALAPARMLAFLTLVISARHLQLALLNRAMRGDLRPHQILVTPLLDFLMLYAWLAALFSNRVTWRGYEARIGPNTELLQRAA